MAEDERTRLEADRLTYDRRAGHITAEGGVVLKEGTSELRAEQAELDLSTNRATLGQARARWGDEPFFVTGDKIERSDPERYVVERGTVTTCVCRIWMGKERPTWRVRARRLKVRLNGYLVARGVRFEVAGVPVLYLPALVLPVKSGRQTGLLVPRLGRSSTQGITFSQPFYWVISPHQDTTVTLDYRSRLGRGADLEYRYRLRRSGSGIFQGTWFDNLQDGSTRLSAHAIHDQRFGWWEGRRMRGHADLQYVNRVQLFRELSERTEDRSLRSIESNLVLSGAGPLDGFHLLTRYTRDLTTAVNDTILQRLPQLAFSRVFERPGELPLFLHLDTSAVHFWRETGLKAYRIDLFPRVVGRWSPGPFVLTPQLGVRETAYSRGAGSSDAVHRILPAAALRADAPWRGRWGNARYRVEPMIEYSDVREITHDAVPQFDQIDRATAKRELTYTLGGRWWDGAGMERGWLKIARSYDLQTPASSDLRGTFWMRIGPSLRVETDTFYDPSRRTGTLTAADLHWGRGGWDASIGRRTIAAGPVPDRGDAFSSITLLPMSAAAPVRFLSGGATIPFGPFSFSSRVLYDEQEGKLQEQEYRLQFLGQCWGFTVNYLLFPEKRQVTFMVHLKGAGTTQSSPLQRATPTF